MARSKNTRARDPSVKCDWIKDDGEKCNAWAMKGRQKCSAHGNGGRPPTSGYWSKALAHLPTLRQIMDDRGNLTLPQRAQEQMDILEALASEAAATPADNESDVARLERMMGYAHKTIMAHTELAKQARFWAEALARAAIDATVDHVVAEIRQEVSPEQFVRVVRRVRRVRARLP